MVSIPLRRVQVQLMLRHGAIWYRAVYECFKDLPNAYDLVNRCGSVWRTGNYEKTKKLVSLKLLDQDEKQVRDRLTCQKFLWNCMQSRNNLCSSQSKCVCHSVYYVCGLMTLTYNCRQRGHSTRKLRRSSLWPYMFRWWMSCNVIDTGLFKPKMKCSTATIGACRWSAHCDRRKVKITCAKIQKWYIITLV